MTNNRDEFSEETKRVLTLRVAARCSNPECRKPTSGPNTDPKKATNVGVAAHICAAAPGGPRYDATMSPEERKSPCNGIWLCQTCAKLIDSDEKYYTKEKLHNWKNLAESVARLALEKTAYTEAATIENYEGRWFSSKEEGVQVKWGYSRIDNYCKLSPGSIVLLAGYTETDASVYAQNIVRQIIKASGRGIYFNLKESSTDIMTKMLAAESFIKSEHIRTAVLTEEEWTHLCAAIWVLGNSQLLYEPYNLNRSMGQLLLKGVQYGNADFVVIDDLYGLGLDGNALSSFMYQLRSAATESKTTIFIVVNIDDKPKRMDKRPMLSDPKISELHKFADVVQFIYWDDFDNYTSKNDIVKMEVIMAKNYTDTKTCTIRLAKLHQYSAVAELEEGDDKSFAQKYPGVIAGLDLFAEYLESM